MKTRLQLLKTHSGFNLKTILLFLPFYFFLQFTAGQTVVLDNLENPGGLQVINNHLYFTEFIRS